MTENPDQLTTVKTMPQQFKHTCLELCGGIEFWLNGVQLHPEVLLIHLDSISTFSLNLLFDQYLSENDKYGSITGQKKQKQKMPGHSNQIKQTDGIHKD